MLISNITEHNLKLIHLDNVLPLWAEEVFWGLFRSMCHFRLNAHTQTEQMQISCGRRTWSDPEGHTDVQDQLSLFSPVFAAAVL